MFHWSAIIRSFAYLNVSYFYQFMPSCQMFLIIMRLVIINYTTNNFNDFYFFVFVLDFSLLEIMGSEKHEISRKYETRVESVGC